MFTVYAHTNRKTGEKYIGITSGNPLARWNNGKGYSRNKKFYPAIIAYGWDGFDHEIIAQGLDKTAALQMEQSLIRKYKTIENGYNNDDSGKYAERGSLRGEARLVYDGMLSNKHIPGFQEYIDFFRDADKSQGRLSDVVNTAVHLIIQRKTQRERPCYGDPVFLSSVLYDFNYLSACIKAEQEGKELPRYYSQEEYVAKQIFKE
jgi:hypothetical protein